MSMNFTPVPATSAPSHPSLPTPSSRLKRWWHLQGWEETPEQSLWVPQSRMGDPKPDMRQSDMISCWVARLLAHPRQKPSLQLTFIVSL